jgi:MFS family permease
VRNVVPPRLGALRERNLALLVASSSISTLGSGMAQVALAFAVLKIGSPSDLGFVLLAREVPLVVLVLLGGVWADRVSRQRLLVAGDVTRGSAQALAAVLLLVGTAEVWNLAALQIAYGAAEAFTRPASTGLIQQAVRPQHLQQANALIDLSRSSLRIVGPAAGAAIVVAASPGWALGADAMTFFVSASLLAGMRIPATARVRGKNVLADLRDGWREFTSRTWVWTMVTGFGVFQLSLFPALLVLGPYVAKTELGGAGAWGAILASQAAGAVLGGIAALRFRPSRPLLTSSFLTLPMAALLALLGVAPPVWILCAVGFVASACIATTDILWFTVLQQRVPEHAISRISSFDWFGSVALNPIGYALVGPLADTIGVATTLYAAAAVNAAVAFFITSVPSVLAIRSEGVALAEDVSRTRDCGSSRNGESAKGGKSLRKGGNR